MNFILNINCQIMNSDLYGDVLACFYFKKKFPFSLSVIIFNFKNELYQIISNTFDYELSKISNIKSFISKDYKKAIIYFYNNNYFYFINYFIDLNKFRIYEKNIFCKKNILNIRTKADFIYDMNYINTYKSITIYSSNSELFNLFRLFKKSLNILNYDDKTIKLFNKNLTVKNNMNNFNYIKYKKEEIKNNKITSLRYLDDLSIKCSEVDDYSKKHLLCKSCSSGYYPIVNSNAGDRVAVNRNYKDCYNSDTIPSNYFLNTNNEYEECFITCKTCIEKGNQENNKCTSCIDNYIFNPKIENQNCVKKCEYYYYYNCFGEYKCTDNYYCPETNSFFIEEEKRCIDDCNNAGIYSYQYEGECISVCPSNTRLSDINNLCKDKNNKCILNSRKIKILGKFLSPNIINLMAKYYADEFSYTFNHVTKFIGDNYYIYFYKNKSCLSELHLENYFLDCNECLLKISNNNNGLIPLVARIDILGKYNNPTTKYAFFNPNTGEKYDTKVCEGTTIIIKKNINIFYKKDYDSLIEQNIDFLDINSSFYSDICFSFQSNNSRDILLEDRLLFYYPNVTLCEEGCIYNGTDYTTLFAKCICNFSYSNYDLMNINQLEDEQIKERQDEIFKSNFEKITRKYPIRLFTCIKNILNYNSFLRAYGNFLIIILIIAQIICIFILFLDNFLNKIGMFILTMTNVYRQYYKKIHDIGGKENDDKNGKVLEIVNHGDNVLNKKCKKKSRSKYIVDIALNDNSEHALKLKKINIGGENADKTYISEKQKQLTKITEEYMKLFLSMAPEEMRLFDAIERDKRTFWAYLSYSIVKKEMIINTFFMTEETKPLPLKIIFFTLYIDLFFIWNAVKISCSNENIKLLYNIKTNKQYIKYLFANIVMDIFYSFIVITILRNLLLLFLIDKVSIRDILKKEKHDNDELLNKNIKKYNKLMKIRYIAFIILDGIIMITSWIYVYCFNVVFSNTKLHWIISSIIVIVSSSVLYIILACLETILRFLAVKCKIEFIFTFSKFIDKI